MTKPTEFIKAIRESFHGAETVYTEGSCWQFYKILKLIYPYARPLYDPIDGHVYVEIFDKVYDIKGELVDDAVMLNLEAIPNPDLSLEELESWKYQLPV